MTDEFGNRIPANQHPRKLPAVDLGVRASGVGGELLIFVVSLVVLVAIGATAIMAAWKVTIWAWS